MEPHSSVAAGAAPDPAAGVFFLSALGGRQSRLAASFWGAAGGLLLFLLVLHHQVARSGPTLDASEAGKNLGAACDPRAGRV